jgi:small subunit ribosomal protein S17
VSDNENNETVATERNKRPAVIGTVVSHKMDKTIIVRRDRLVLHPLYKKYMRRSTRLAVHDADNAAYLGDEVEIVQTRPLSKTKRWRLVKVLRSAPRAEDDAPAAAPADAESSSEGDA